MDWSKVITRMSKEDLALLCGKIKVKKNASKRTILNKIRETQLEKIFASIEQ